MKKTILITGTSSEIGKSMAKYFSEKEWMFSKGGQFSTSIYTQDTVSLQSQDLVSKTENKLQNMKLQILLIFIVLGLSTEMFAQTKDTIQGSSLKLDLVLVDYPYQTDAFKTNKQGSLMSSFWFYPSMHQSLSLSKDLYSSAHYGLDKLFNVQDNYLQTRYKPIHLASLLATDFVLSFVPLGDGWLHEEYHRAIMNKHHVDSYNNINRFPIGQDLAPM